MGDKCPASVSCNPMIQKNPFKTLYLRVGESRICALSVLLPSPFFFSFFFPFFFYQTTSKSTFVSPYEDVIHRAFELERRDRCPKYFYNFCHTACLRIRRIGTPFSAGCSWTGGRAWCLPSICPPHGLVTRGHEEKVRSCCIELQFWLESWQGKL